MKTQFTIGSAIFAGFVLAAILTHPADGQPTPSGQQTTAHPREAVVFNDGLEPRGVGEKSLRWTAPLFAGDCTMTDAEIVIRSNGTASWRSNVRSTGSDDAWCTILTFHDRNGLERFRFGRMCSQTLTSVLRPWINHRLAIPEELFPYITSATAHNSC